MTRCSLLRLAKPLLILRGANSRKRGLGMGNRYEISPRLPAWSAGIGERLCRFIERQRFSELPVSVAPGIRAGSLLGPHRDPFDRMLIAQALAEDLAIVSNETIFDQYGIRRLW